MELFAMSITRRTLAKLASAREIPSGLDEAWQARTSINPVKEAVELEHERGEKITFSLAVVLIAILSAFTTGMLSATGATWMESVRPTAFVNVAITASCILYLLYSLCDIFLPRSNSQIDTEIAAFCTDVSSFLSWTEEDELPAQNELLRAATEILLAQAKQVIHIQTDKSLGSEERDRLELEAKQEMNRRYDTMERLGLASGGTGKCYKAAEKALTKEKSTAA